MTAGLQRVKMPLPVAVERLHPVGAVLGERERERERGRERERVRTQ